MKSSPVNIMFLLTKNVFISLTFLTRVVLFLYPCTFSMSISAFFFFITVFFLFLVDALLKKKTASLLELVNNTLIHKSYINYKKCHLKFKVCTYT